MRQSLGTGRSSGRFSRPLGRAGFTLTEVMIVVAILGIIASIAPKMLIDISRFSMMNRTRLELQKEARESMVVMTRNLRQASENSVLIDRSAGQPHYSRITFTKASGQKISFYQSGNKLIMLVGTRSRTLSSNIRYLTFAFPRSDDLGIVSIGMTLEKAIFEGKHKAFHLASERVRVMNP